MINISIICQALDLGLIKFIKNLSKDNIQIKWIIVAPSCEIHPVRIKQMGIHKAAIGKKKKNILTLLKAAFRFLFELFKVKKKVIQLLIFFLGCRNDFRVIYLNKDWETNHFDAFKLITVIYSLEGLLTKETISKFDEGIINIHPAIIPEYRGLDAGLWALVGEGPLGVSAYLVDEGIDTGPIISTYVLPESKFTNIELYLSKIKTLKYNSYSNAIFEYTNKNFENINPKITKSQNRGVMPLDTLVRLVTKTSITGRDEI